MTTDASRLLVAFGDTALLGNAGNPYVLTLRAAFRSEDSETVPSQTALTGATLYNPYDSRCTLGTCTIFGNLPTASFGNHRTASYLDQQYTAFNASINRLFGSHDLKFGVNFLRTEADGRRSAASAESAVRDDGRLRAIRRRHRRRLSARRRRRTHALETTRFICATTTPHSSCRTIGNCPTI